MEVLSKNLAKTLANIFFTSALHRYTVQRKYYKKKTKKQRGGTYKKPIDRLKQFSFQEYKNTRYRKV